MAEPIDGMSQGKSDSVLNVSVGSEVYLEEEEEEEGLYEQARGGERGSGVAGLCRGHGRHWGGGTGGQVIPTFQSKGDNIYIAPLPHFSAIAIILLRMCVCVRACE